MGTGVVKVWNLTKERWNSIGVLEWLRQCLLASLRNTNLWVSVADAGRIRQNYIVPVTCYLLTFLSDMSGLRKLCKDVHGVTRVASLLRTEHLVTPFNLECIISGLNAIIILFFFHFSLIQHLRAPILTGAPKNTILNRQVRWTVAPSILQSIVSSHLSIGLFILTYLQSSQRDILRQVLPWPSTPVIDRFLRNGPWHVSFAGTRPHGTFLVRW